MTDAHPVPPTEPPQLSLFENKRVVDTTVKCSGTITHVYGKPARELRHGEVLITVTIVEVDKVAFPKADGGGVTREQTVKVQELFELDLPELDTRRLLADLRAKVRKDVEARYGEADKGDPGGDHEVTITSGDSEVKTTMSRLRAIGDQAFGQ